MAADSREGGHTRPSFPTMTASADTNLEAEIFELRTQGPQPQAMP